MRNRSVKLGAILMTTGMLLTGTASAFNFGNMMNPSRWFGGNRNYDRYDDYGPPGGYGYGYPGYGYSGYGYPGYGAPGYGGAPGYYGTGPGYGDAYGYGGAPGYGSAPGYGGATGYGGPAGNEGVPTYGGTPAYEAPAAGSDDTAAEIRQLKERIRRLEQNNP